MNGRLLDCTLRDGAYVTGGYWGCRTVQGIINNLNEANIDCIEVGWLRDAKHEIGSSYFQFTEEIIPFLPINKKSRFLAMVDFGKYDIEKLSYNDGSSIDSIRLVFHKEDLAQIADCSSKIISRNYKLYLQAYNTPSYKEEELFTLADTVNDIMPDTLSIVDTNGCMYPEDLEKIFYVLNKQLDKKIKLGFHSHNNLQLSFALSIEFMKLCQHFERDFVVDSSLCGIGRGAGNTCTELLTNYLNKKLGKNYNTDIIIKTIDEHISDCLKNYNWGYSIPMCIAGQLGVHANNVKHILENYSISFCELKNILENISEDDRKITNYEKFDNVLNSFTGGFNKHI